jgi:hypothetical protein
VINLNKEKSKQFSKFEYNFFELDIPSSANLFTYIDPWTIDQLSPEEKLIAEDMLIEALSKEIKRVWLFGLSEMETDKSYDFLMKLFDKEKDIYTKTQLSSSIIRINLSAPVLEFINDVIQSDEPESTKSSALSTIYWLKNSQFKKKEKNELYQTILHSAFTDKNKKIRKQAYEILKERFGMRKYTPIKDPILEIILEERKKEDYTKALQIFEKNVESKEILPFSRKAIVQFIKELPNNPPEIKIIDCEICKTIDDREYADMMADESLKNSTSKLETVIIISYYEDCIKRCPLCGRLYVYDYHYEYFVNSQSEEEETLTRSDSKGAMKKIDKFIKQGYDFKKITKCGIYLKIDYR